MSGAQDGLDDVARLRTTRLRLVRARVSGASMLPTLAEGDFLLCRPLRRPGRGRGVRPGDVVVLERPDRPGLVLIKRVVRREGDGWWVEGDNPAESADSRVFGPVPESALLARALARYSPTPRRL